MTQEAVKALADNALEQVSLWVQEEIKVRAEKKRQDAIARIKEIAAAQHIVVNIGGARGRPAKTQNDKATKNGTH